MTADCRRMDVREEREKNRTRKPEEDACDEMR